MGTEKYPEEDLYERTLAEHGGTDNACTEDDCTYYYFEVENEMLEQIIDIYSQFFKNPLFTASATGREVNAVDNEYKRNLSCEYSAFYQIMLNHIAVPGSIFDRFGTGCKETLEVEGILDELRLFYERNYSSNLMSLVIVSRASLDELEAMTVKHFKDVQNRELPLIDHSSDVVFDKQHSFQKVFKVVPSKEYRQLSINWQLPSEKRFEKK